MNARSKILKLAIIATGLSMMQATQAEKVFSLSFDNQERTPVETVIYSDKDKTAAEKIQKSDSIRLVKGVKGAGVYLDNRYEYIALPESASVSAEQGAISFWVRPMPSAAGKNRYVILVEFAKGRFLLLSETAFAVLDGKSQWNYGPNSPAAAAWQQGQWHHIVLNWSARVGKKQVFVDGKGESALDYVPPVGKGRVFLSPLPTDVSGAYPVCGVLDEFAIYDQPLTEEAIAALYTEGKNLLGDSAANTNLEISLYPNLAREAAVTLTPAPNYQNGEYTCNGPDDKAKLADNQWQLAWYGTKQTVGWAAPKITLDYDLGALKEIGAVGINIGAGDSGVVFPRKVTFYTGATVEKLVKAGEIVTAEPVPNPAYPKWHDRLIGVANIGCAARFVRIEVEGLSLFTDEVFIIEKDAQPVFASTGEQK